MLRPTQNGWVQSGRLYDIQMKAAHVGKGTHVSTQGGLVTFSVEDLSVEVDCHYDLRLSSFKYKETGNVRARLFGDSMSLNFPVEGSRARRVPLRQGPRPGGGGRFKSV